MQFTQVISATPHPLDVYAETGTRSVLELPHSPEHPFARCDERSVPVMGNDECGVCGGEGDVQCGSHQGNGCEYCGDTRRVVCSACHGSGKKS